VSTIEKTIDVDVPVRAAYNQWTQFVDFPRFMEGVERVEQRGDTMTHWVTRVAGVTREFDAQIVEQEPDRVVHWRSVTGPRQEGEVLFEVIDQDRTRVKLNMQFDPEGMVEKAADALHLVARRAEADLERFKRFIEERGVETGAWRGGVDEVREQGSLSGTERPGPGGDVADSSTTSAERATAGPGDDSQELRDQREMDADVPPESPEDPGRPRS
jgi:ribosome-associated toxin RatA of RatAB toxin-antitoxin module